jgi:hypothetical protein
MPITVPDSVLAPGREYAWSGICHQPSGAIHRIEAAFVTLSGDVQRRRERFRSALLAATGADPLALAAEVDVRLGLLHEAVVTLRLAAAAEPTGSDLQSRLARLEREMQALR